MWVSVERVDKEVIKEQVKERVKEREMVAMFAALVLLYYNLALPNLL